MKHVKTYESFLYESSVKISDLTKDREFLKFVTDKWGPEYVNIESKEDLNDGYCILVSDFLKKKYPQGEVWTIGNPMSYHVATKIGNKFYDAVDTDGVNRLEDLTWAKNRKSPLNPVKGTPYEH